MRARTEYSLFRFIVFYSWVWYGTIISTDFIGWELWVRSFYWPTQNDEHKYINSLQLQTKLVFWWNKIKQNKDSWCTWHPEEEKPKMTDMDDGDILDDSLQGKILSLLTGNCSTYCSHRPIRHHYFRIETNYIM